jgi:hypothetical protein
MSSALNRLVVMLYRIIAGSQCIVALARCCCFVRLYLIAAYTRERIGDDRRNLDHSCGELCAKLDPDGQNPNQAERL